MPRIKHKRYLLPFTPSPLPTQVASGAVIGELVLCTATGRVWSIGATGSGSGQTWVPFPVAPVAVGESNPGIKERVFFDQGGTAPAELVLKREINGRFTNEVPTTFTQSVTVSSLVSSLVSTDGAGQLIATNLNASTLLGRRSGSSGAAESITVGDGLEMTTGSDLKVDTAFVQEEMENDLLRPGNPTIYRDDFSRLTLTTGMVGDLGWRFAGGSVTAGAPEADHPGILTRTSATTGTSSLHLRATTTDNIFVWEDAEQMYVVLKLAATNNDYDMRFGIANTADAGAASGAYFERLAANNYWTPVMVSGGNTNATLQQWAIDTDWHTFHIHKTGQNVVKFAVDGVQSSESISSGQIGNTTGMQWFFHVTPTGGTARVFSLDFFSGKIAATTR